MTPDLSDDYSRREREQKGEDDKWHGKKRRKKKIGTNNGTTDLIEMSPDLYHSEVTPSFRSRNLVSRVGHEILVTIPPTRQ